jgi:hypothetical protein
MPTRASKTGSELFIVDNSNEDWKALRYLHDWCQISRAFDVASGYFEIGALRSSSGRIRANTGGNCGHEPTGTSSTNRR